jgi:hypothetical protein
MMGSGQDASPNFRRVHSARRGRPQMTCQCDMIVTVAAGPGRQALRFSLVRTRKDTASTRLGRPGPAGDAGERSGQVTRATSKAGAMEGLEPGPGAHHRSLSPGSGPAAALLARRRSARHGDSKPSESRCWVPRSGAEPNVNGRHVGEGLGGSSLAGRPIECHRIRNRVKGCISATEAGRCRSGTLV